jgi:hypothetical protein
VRLLSLGAIAQRVDGSTFFLSYWSLWGLLILCDRCPEIPMRMSAYLATILSLPPIFTATSIKLLVAAFSLPLTITYSSPSWPTTFFAGAGLRNC